MPSTCLSATQVCRQGGAEVSPLLLLLCSLPGLLLCGRPGSCQVNIFVFLGTWRGLEENILGGQCMGQHWVQTLVWVPPLPFGVSVTVTPHLAGRGKSCKGPGLSRGLSVHVCTHMFRGSPRYGVTGCNSCVTRSSGQGALRQRAHEPGSWDPRQGGRGSAQLSIPTTRLSLPD